MGRATRWLKGLFGIKKNRGETEHSDSGDRRDKNGSFGHSGRGSTGLCHNPATIPPNITPAEASWLRSFYNESDNEQSKHAIAVAAATAAAADAAVAAAKAAVAVVRLTSRGRDTPFGRGGERWAAVKIQTIFRGYLSRKALRALKGLVKLQALVRGYLVRKQANATFHSIQALIRAQATVCAQRAGLSFNRYGGGGGSGDECFHPQYRCRKSIKKFDETRNEKNTSIHSRRLSSSSFETLIANPLDEPPKIVEVDTGTTRPKSRSRRTNSWVSDSGNSSGGHCLSYYQTPATRLSIPTRRNPSDSYWDLAGDECRSCYTAQSTPKFANSCGSHTPVTPARSVCVDNFFRQHADFPNYMASTQSFKAKLRSQSAPKQRIETGHKKKLSLSEMMDSRSSVSGVKMQSSCSQVHEVINFKNAVMGNFNRSSDFY